MKHIGGKVRVYHRIETCKSLNRAPSDVKKICQWSLKTKMIWHRMSEGIKELRSGSYCVRYVLFVIDFYFIVTDYHI